MLRIRNTALSIILAAIAGFGMQAALAQESTKGADDAGKVPATKSSKTRADARAEGAQARRSGKEGSGEASATEAVPPLKSKPISSTYKGREKERAETVEARKKGQIPKSNEAN